ncbi:MAG: heavy metal translocating P-type ATPase [Lachnospiraceae bacterium]|nr:heavy metal translocating P-type ATPase [Lachnospiraceae bacterium]
MKFRIKHDIKGRMRVQLSVKSMTFREADTLFYYLNNALPITKAVVYERTCDAAIEYVGEREEIILLLTKFRYEDVDVPETFLQTSGRELNQKYFDKLVITTIVHFAKRIFLPRPIRIIICLIKYRKYLWRAIKAIKAGKLEVSLLDAIAIGVSLIRGDFNGASSIMFMQRIGEILEDWTHKKSTNDLARSMSLNISHVWLVKGDEQVLVSADEIMPGDVVRVHMGNVIPFDGVVTDGEAMVNQASLTGESLPVRKAKDISVYAGTVVEEGEISICVKETNGASKFEKIVTMIEETQKLKSSAEAKAEHLADKLVPYTLAGTALTYLFTRDITKMISVLMVDFSCALKLAMPITVISAIRECSLYNITVKGGKYLEAVAEADTIVFDKTGTLTKACPKVVDIIPFNGESKEELLKIAACLEEHFPHSMAKAVVDEANLRGIEHEEMHSKVEYIVAHGIVSTIDDKRVIIGSSHFVFEDEKCVIPEDKKDRFDALKPEESHLYLAIDGSLAGVICISDPIREEAPAVINTLKKIGIKKIVMMTGDSERTAAAIAKEVGVDEFYAEVLPEDKAKFVEMEKEKGRKVIMIGDGINDSPALSAADVGIAISDGAEIAREVADITIAADNLYEIVSLKAISNALIKRIKKNYRTIVGFNTGLIIGGVAGILAPTASSFLHNASTLLISIKSMENLIE